MPRTNITEHFRFKELLKIKGVKSVTIGQTPKGRQCILVEVSNTSKISEDDLPKKIDGYPVLLKT